LRGLKVGGVFMIYERKLREGIRGCQGETFKEEKGGRKKEDKEEEREKLGGHLGEVFIGKELFQSGKDGNREEEGNWGSLDIWTYEIGLCCWEFWAWRARKPQGFPGARELERLFLAGWEVKILV
jgi:hypothetical protein